MSITRFAAAFIFLASGAFAADENLDAKGAAELFTRIGKAAGAYQITELVVNGETAKLGDKGPKVEFIAAGTDLILLKNVGGFQALELTAGKAEGRLIEYSKASPEAFWYAPVTFQKSGFTADMAKRVFAKADIAKEKPKVEVDGDAVGYVFDFDKGEVVGTVTKMGGKAPLKTSFKMEREKK